MELGKIRSKYDSSESLDSENSLESSASSDKPYDESSASYDAPTRRKSKGSNQKRFQPRQGNPTKPVEVSVHVGQAAVVSPDSPSTPNGSEPTLGVRANRPKMSRQKSVAAKVGGFILSNLVGIKIDKEEKEVAVPEGYELKFTDKGQSYLAKKPDPTSPRHDEEVAEEHVRKGAFISLCASRSLLGREYGEGVYQYFDFVLFLCVTNFVLQLICLIPLGAHLGLDGWDPRVLFYSNLFTATYSSQIKIYWFWSMVGCSFLYTFVFGPALARRISNRFDKIGYEDTEDKYGGGAGLDIIKDKKGFPQNPVHISGVRMFFSYVLFIVILAISGSITLGLVMAQTYFDVSLPVSWSFIVSIVLEITNFVWKKVCLALTHMEQHYTWTSFNKHHTLKYFLWRFLNVSIMFLGRWLAANGLIDNVPLWSWIKDLAKRQNPVTTCDLNPVGEQLAILLIIDITVGNLIDLGVPWLRHKLALCCRKDQMGSTLEYGRPEFDIAEGYLNYMYRQYIVYLGLAFFPLIGAFGLIANIIDYQMDKLLLLRIARTPPPLRGSMKHYLIFFLFITAITSIAVFPYGAGWVLSGFTLESRCSSGNGIYSVPFNAVFGGLNVTIPA